MFQKTNAQFPSEREMGITRTNSSEVPGDEDSCSGARLEFDGYSNRRAWPLVSSVTVWGREGPRCYFESMLVVLQL